MAKAIRTWKLFNDSSDRRVVVAGDAGEVTRVLQLLKQLDTGMGFQTRVYRMRNIAADRVRKLILGLVSQDDAESAIETTVDPDGNLLIVRAAPEIQQQVETLIRELDQPVDSTESPIQFYKLKKRQSGRGTLFITCVAASSWQRSSITSQWIRDDHCL